MKKVKIKLNSLLTPTGWRQPVWKIWRCCRAFRELHRKNRCGFQRQKLVVIFGSPADRSAWRLVSVPPWIYLSDFGETDFLSVNQSLLYTSCRSAFTQWHKRHYENSRCLVLDKGMYFLIYTCSPSVMPLSFPVSPPIPFVKLDHTPLCTFITSTSFTPVVISLIFHHYSEVWLSFLHNIFSRPISNAIL